MVYYTARVRIVHVPRSRARATVIERQQYYYIIIQLIGPFTC